MHIFIFVITVALCYFILRKAYTKWVSADYESRKEEVKNVNEQYIDLNEFKARNKTKIKNKEKQINNFIKGDK